jgi:hypothetical protein
MPFMGYKRRENFAVGVIYAPKLLKKTNNSDIIL